MHFLGLDLAWSEGSATQRAPDTGVALLDTAGRILDAGWTSGIEETLSWIESVQAPDSLLFVDAPLIVNNPSGQRLCEKQVGQRYGRWAVSANSTNPSSPRLAGVCLREELEQRGWRYSDSRDGPPKSGRVVCECYPYTTLVGVEELGYNAERPRYKRPPKGMRAAEWRPLRAGACDELIRRLDRLKSADPPLDLLSNSETERLLSDCSPFQNKQYKRREDLIDAVLCAWTAAFWWRHGDKRSQVLGVDLDNAASKEPLATIIAPARPEQRNPLCRGNVTNPAQMPF
jgi:predicted RNase H-like nuclease